MRIAMIVAMTLLTAKPAIVLGQGPVYIADPNLQAAIEKTIGVRDPSAAAMLLLTDLRAESQGIRDLTGLEHARNLKILQLRGNQIHDIAVLTGLVKLEFLDLADNCIKDLPRLAELTRLTWLVLYHNEFNDFAAAREKIGLKDAIIVFYEGNRDLDLTRPALETAIVRSDNGYVLNEPYEDEGSQRVPLPGPVRKKVCEVTLKAFLREFYEGIEPQKYSALFGPVFCIRVPDREALLLYVYLINGIGTLPHTICLITYDSDSGRAGPDLVCFSGQWMGTGWPLVPMGAPCVDFDDLDLDGQLEIVFKERIHNGNVLNAVVHHFFHVGSDLCLVPILRLEKYTCSPFSLRQDGRDRYLVRSVEKVGPGRIHVRVSLSADPFAQGEQGIGYILFESAGVSSTFGVKETFTYVGEKGWSEMIAGYYRDSLVHSRLSPYR
ncbi:MAG: leucine-rich repeat domain-containing protein [Phycisphaerae bacterium]|nr:leucine-rich repeat domain-containing protein [Phycisphaerae bacterium]